MLVSEIQAGSAKRTKYTGKWNKRPKYHNIMEGMSANMIKIENLVKRYGSRKRFRFVKGKETAGENRHGTDTEYRLQGVAEGQSTFYM